MKTIRQLLPAIKASRVIGVVDFEEKEYRLRLVNCAGDTIRPQLKEPATNKWFFVCGPVNHSFTLEGLQMLLLEHYVSNGATITFDRSVLKESDSPAI